MVPFLACLAWFAGLAGLPWLALLACLALLAGVLGVFELIPKTVFEPWPPEAFQDSTSEFVVWVRFQNLISVFVLRMNFDQSYI